MVVLCVFYDGHVHFPGPWWLDGLILISTTLWSECGHALIQALALSVRVFGMYHRSSLDLKVKSLLCQVNIRACGFCNSPYVAELIIVCKVRELQATCVSGVRVSPTFVKPDITDTVKVPGDY